MSLHVQTFPLYLTQLTSSLYHHFINDKLSYTTEEAACCSESHWPSDDSVTAELLLWNTYRKCWQQLNNDQEEQIHQVSLREFQTAVNTSCMHFILKVYRWHSGWKTFNVKHLEEVIRKQELEWGVGLKLFVCFIYLIHQWRPSFVCSLRRRDDLNFFFLNNLTLNQRSVLEQNVPLNQSPKNKDTNKHQLQSNEGDQTCVSRE